MPTRRMDMRQVRELVRLHREAGLGMRATARLGGIAESTLRGMMKRFDGSGLTWSAPAELSNAELEQKLYDLAGRKPGQRKMPEPDWVVVHRDLKRKHVTLQTLWEEYIEAHPESYRYSRFCDLYRSWEGRLPVTMRQTHQAGDKLFVDYAGDTQPMVVDRLTGEIRTAHSRLANYRLDEIGQAAAQIIVVFTIIAFDRGILDGPVHAPTWPLAYGCFGLISRCSMSFRTHISSKA